MDKTSLRWMFFCLLVALQFAQNCSIRRNHEAIESCACTTKEPTP